MSGYLTSQYITPANRIVLDGKTIDVAYGTQDEVVIACDDEEILELARGINEVS